MRRQRKRSERIRTQNDTVRQARKERGEQSREQVPTTDARHPSPDPNQWREDDDPPEWY